MNKFLKLLLMALITALLPGCGSDDKKSSGSTGGAASDEGDQGNAAVDENPAFATLFKLFSADKKALVLELDGVALNGKTGAGSAQSGFGSTARITFKAGADETKVGEFIINDGGVNDWQAVGTAARVAAGTTLTADSLAGFAMALVKTGDVPTITVTTPTNYGKGTDNNAGTAGGASDVSTQAQRTFQIRLNAAPTGSETSQSAVVRLLFTIEGKTVEVPAKVSIS